MNACRGSLSGKWEYSSDPGVAMNETVTFKPVERDGWEERAELYDSYTAQLTNPPIEALLDAAQISPAQVVLDVRCGTGSVSPAARHDETIVFLL